MLLNLFAPKQRPPVPRSFAATIRHLGALGLFFLAILDSSPIPSFSSSDLLIAVLSASHRNPWFEYAATATAGSIIGAYITFRLARKAGSSGSGCHFPGGALLDHRPGRGAVRPPFHPCTPPSHAILGLVAAVRRNYGWVDRWRNPDQPPLRSCTREVNADEHRKVPKLA